jgi:hypothetical protein
VRCDLLHELPSHLTFLPRRNYVDQATALAKNLTFASADTLVLRADSTTVLNPSGAGRDSVRIRSVKTYTTHVAGACSHIVPLFIDPDAVSQCSTSGTCRRAVAPGRRHGRSMKMRGLPTARLTWSRAQTTSRRTKSPYTCLPAARSPRTASCRGARTPARFLVGCVLITALRSQEGTSGRLRHERERKHGLRCRAALDRVVRARVQQCAVLPVSSFHSQG